MKLVVGYDRDLAAQCYRRNLFQLIRPGANPLHRITVAEVEYFADRLAETSVFSYSDRLGSPWVTKDEAVELIRVSPKKATRAQLQKCELVANNLLILQGVIHRVGAHVSMSFQEAEEQMTGQKVVGKLYRNAALSPSQNSKSVEILVQMSRHVSDWVRYLSYLPGNDFMDLLSTSPSQRIYCS